MTYISVLACVGSGARPEGVAEVVSARADLRRVGLTFSAGEALALARNFNPDVLLVMGAVDGWDGVQFARALRKERDTPVVLVLPPDRVAEVRLEVRRRRLSGVAVLGCPTGAQEGKGARWIADRLVRLAEQSMCEEAITDDESVVPTMCAVLGDPSVTALADRSVDAVVMLGSAGTPKLLPRIVAGASQRGLCVPLIVAVHHNRRLSPGFAEWVGSLVGLPPDPFDPRRTVLRGASSMLQVVRTARFPPDQRPQPDLGEVLERLLAQRLRLVVLVGSGMRDDSLACLHRVRPSQGSVVVLDPRACAHPQMARQVMQARACDAVVGPAQMSWLITNVRPFEAGTMHLAAAV